MVISKPQAAPMNRLLYSHLTRCFVSSCATMEIFSPVSFIIGREPQPYSLYLAGYVPKIVNVHFYT